jgi:hypothetical protein
MDIGCFLNHHIISNYLLWINSLLPHLKITIYFMFQLGVFQLSKQSSSLFLLKISAILFAVYDLKCRIFSDRFSPCAMM